MINKFTIGSANFGLEYGVSNKRKLTKEEAFHILDLAFEKNIPGIDTARAYGAAEKVIGEYFGRSGKTFKVITKLPPREYLSPADVEKEVFESLDNLSIPFIDCVLMHSYETYKLYGRTIVPVLQSLKRDGVLGTYGASVYHPEEAETLVREVDDNPAIEFPVNLFDQRFLKDNLLQKLKTQGALLYARSVFLQGLFFLDETSLAGKFLNVTGQIRRIRELSSDYSIRPESIALLFVITNPSIDRVVFGIDSREHLEVNTGSLAGENINNFELLRHQLSGLEIRDEDIILPYKWGVN